MFRFALCFVLFLTLCNGLSAQQPFYFRYNIEGLGSNYMYNPYPEISIQNDLLTYSVNIGTKKPIFGGKPITPKWKVTYKAIVRKSSNDSIIALMNTLADTSIFASNPCIMSGAIYYVTVADAKRKVAFTLMNAFDRTALKMVDIVNSYLPDSIRIYANEKMITDVDSCNQWLLKQSKDH